MEYLCHLLATSLSKEFYIQQTTARGNHSDINKVGLYASFVTTIHIEIKIKHCSEGWEVKKVTSWICDETIGKWCCQNCYLKVVLSTACHEIRPMYNATLSTKAFTKIHPDTGSLFYGQNKPKKLKRLPHFRLNGAENITWSSDRPSQRRLGPL